MTSLRNDRRARPEPRFTRPLRRAILGVLAFLVLGGPSPGFVGSCNPAVVGAPDRYEFCVQERSAICSREYGSGREDMAAFEACVNAIFPTCESRRTWGDCIPTRIQLDTCLGALRDEARYVTPTTMITECMNYCAMPLTVDSDGI